MTEKHTSLWRRWKKRNENSQVIPDRCGLTTICCMMLQILQWSMHYVSGYKKIVSFAHAFFLTLLWWFSGLTPEIDRVNINGDWYLVCIYIFHRYQEYFECWYSSTTALTTPGSSHRRQRGSEAGMTLIGGWCAIMGCEWGPHGMWINSWGPHGMWIEPSLDLG